jgi:hypothetical protein
MEIASFIYGNGNSEYPAETLAGVSALLGGGFRNGAPQFAKSREPILAHRIVISCAAGL